ncbi:fibronectin type III domain-containing protein [Treponema vincentii]|uniref:fibronectin type III domain-containing protein n=1 Tax=Treponema vincentii TaxID=69710 RepID=UPI001E4C5CFF|nr:fibronectin type III domain-containing protein [Treponema vincentii]
MGTYDNGSTVEDTFTDTKIKTRQELKKAGLEKLKEKRKEENPVFEVETLLPIRLFDEVSLVHPKSNTIYDVTVQEEHISYKENKLTQKFGIGGFLFNPLSALIPQKDNDTERKIVKSPVCSGNGKQNAISITWEADGEDFVIRWKEKTQDFYNYRHTKQKQEVIERLKADTDYTFSVASVSDGLLSDYTAEVVCRPLSADMSL